MSAVSVGAALRGILESAVGKRALPASLNDQTELLGAIPELDSMAVLGVLTQIQDDFGVQIDDDEVSADIFQTFGDLKRFVEAKDRHTTTDRIAFILVLINYYKDVERLTIVLDNLSTHKPEAFYEHFAPQQAKAILDKLEFVFTPPHGSWLNIAEIELSVLIGQCLKRRIPDKQTLADEIKAWQQYRDDKQVKIEWTFNVEAAREKLKRIYPKITASTQESIDDDNRKIQT